jgi:hypothetical protein
MGSGFAYLFGRYGREGIELCGEVFEAIGALEIAQSLKALEFTESGVTLESEDPAARLISDRTGYDYDSIKKWVQSQLK